MVRYCKDCFFYQDGDRCAADPRVPQRLVQRNVNLQFAGWRTNPVLQREDGWFISLIIRTCGRRGRWWRPKQGQPRTEAA